MIDKTDSRIDLLIEALINQGKLYLGILTKKYREFIELTRRHKVLTRVILGLLILFTVTGVALYRFIPREVTFIVDNSKATYSSTHKTQARTVEDFIEERGYEIEPLDVLSVKADEKITNRMTIKFRKAFDVAITADGQTISIKTPSCTVKKALKKAGIKLDDDDIVIPELDERLRNGDTIVVKRVEVKYTTEIEKIPYETKTIRTDELRIGKHGIVQKGKYGKVKNFYKLIYVDGKFYKKKLYKQKVKKKPTTEIKGYGTRISFDGAPAGLNYKSVITCRAVSYHFPGHPYGAGGLPCTYGTMAVDPSVIPMGTKCYVEGYGYAIANDVGSGIKGNEVDLFMEANFQCLMWGAHYTKVYILE